MQWDLNQRIQRGIQRLPVAFDDLLAFAAVAAGDSIPQLLQRHVARQNLRQLEKRHLHNGIDARAELALARQFCRVDDLETRLALLQHRLNLLRQS